MIISPNPPPTIETVMLPHPQPFLLSRISKLANSYWKYHTRSKQNHPYHLNEFDPYPLTSTNTFAHSIQVYDSRYSISSTRGYMMSLSLTTILLLDDDHHPSRPLRKYCAFTSQTAMTLRFDPVARP